MATKGQTKDKIFVNRYHVLRKLGSGSFGVVHLVEDFKGGTEELKVLKEIPVGDLRPDETVDAVKEARLLSKLNHPGIVKFYDSFIDGELFCIVTEFCEGGDLDDKIHAWKKAGKTFGESLIITWLVQLLLAVQYMHQRKVMHRDLKTRNIFLRNNMIKLGDFGISRIFQGTADVATTFTGTPYYMSPEVLKHEGYNYKSDIWSLGVIVYELCSLKKAFLGQNLMGVMFKIVEGEPPSLPTKYSQDLRRVYERMLLKDPVKRCSAADLLRNPFIAKHIGLLKDKMIDKTPTSQNPEIEAKDIAQCLSESAKKGEFQMVRQERQESRPKTPSERARLRKQQKADEEARKLKEATRISYAENKKKYTDMKQRQTRASVAFPWVEENPDVFENQQEDDFPRYGDVGVQLIGSGGSSDDGYYESHLNAGVDSYDLTLVSDVPEDETLAETYYSQFDDEFEDETSDCCASSSDFEDNDEYGDLVVCMKDALEMSNEPQSTFETTESMAISSTMRNKKIESLRKDCIRMLGSEGFKKAYNYLNKVRFREGEVASDLSIDEGLKKIGVKPRDCFLVDQLLFLEKQEEITKETLS